MIELTEVNRTEIRRETFKFDEEIGDEYQKSDRWTRVVVDGELSGWVPHDAYGQLPQDPRKCDEVEQKYQQSDYV